MDTLVKILTGYFLDIVPVNVRIINRMSLFDLSACVKSTPKEEEDEIPEMEFLDMNSKSYYSKSLLLADCTENHTSLWF